MSTWETRNIRVSRPTFNKLLKMAREQKTTVTTLVGRLVNNKLHQVSLASFFETKPKGDSSNG